MAYFDSSKNRALWDIRLAALKKERDARAAGKEAADIAKAAPQRQMSDGKRVHMTYTDLLKEEADAVKKQPKRARADREPGLGQREKEARSYEKG